MGEGVSETNQNFNLLFRLLILIHRRVASFNESFTNYTAHACKQQQQKKQASPEQMQIHKLDKHVVEKEQAERETRWLVGGSSRTNDCVRASVGGWCLEGKLA